MQSATDSRRLPSGHDGIAGSSCQGCGGASSGSYNVTFFFFFYKDSRGTISTSFIVCFEQCRFPPEMDLSRAADQHGAVRPCEHFCYVIVCLCVKVASQLDDPSRQAVSSLFY